MGLISTVVNWHSPDAEIWTRLSDGSKDIDDGEGQAILVGFCNEDSIELWNDIENIRACSRLVKVLFSGPDSMLTFSNSHVFIRQCEGQGCNAPGKLMWAQM